MTKQTKDDTGGVYLLRNIDRDVWRRARSRAVLEGKSMRTVIIELLDKWAHDGGFVGGARGPKRK
jgi:hypothetical protein